MRKLKLLFVLITLVNMNIGCLPKKVLPKETQEGLNTFGVKIDGKVWLPKGSIGVLGGSRLNSSYYKQNGLVGITAQKATNKEILHLVVLNVRSVGRYSANVDKTQGSQTEYNGSLVDDNYFPYPGGVNTVNITKLDTVKKIISGTFEVQLKGEKNNVIKNLSQGIFDVNYEN